ncbi:MAG: thioredoxin family protein [Pseudobacteriovorax sp.]|nr:thioredoxin family protein [Pseudobacteriovorax sp.]
MLLETPTDELGWDIKPFHLPDASGKEHGFHDAKSPKGRVIAFICNHCPYVKAIADRMTEDFAALMDQGIEVYAVNSNDFSYVPEDSPPRMIEFAKKHGFTFPYLVDQDQKIASTYGAVCTPDFFCFNADGKLAYRGRLDDARLNDASARSTELLDAMLQISATGETSAQQMPSMGCSIKWRH